MNRSPNERAYSRGDRIAASDLRECTARLLGRLDVLIFRLSELSEKLEAMPERIASSIRLNGKEQKQA